MQWSGGNVEEGDFPTCPNVSANKLWMLQRQTDRTKGWRMLQRQNTRLEPCVLSLSLCSILEQSIQRRNLLLPFHQGKAVLANFRLDFVQKLRWDGAGAIDLN